MAGLGAAGFILGLPGESSIAGAQLAPWLSIAGATLLAGGGLWLAATWRHRPEPMALVPAHVAFLGRTPRPQMVVEEPERAPAAQPQPLSAHAQRVEDLDTQIRDLTRQINKAGVMLATGKLSQEGYMHYVEALKERRGRLEASRVDLQLEV